MVDTSIIYLIGAARPIREKPHRSGALLGEENEASPSNSHLGYPVNGKR